MKVIQNDIGGRTDLENLIQRCLLTSAALPDAKNSEEEEWLSDCLKHTEEVASQILKRIQRYSSAGSHNENGNPYRLTEEIIGKIFWLDKNLPETLDAEEKAILDALLMREGWVLNREIEPICQDDLRDIFFKMQPGVTWKDITIQDLHIMKVRGVIDDPERHYYLSHIAHSDEFAN